MTAAAAPRGLYLVEPRPPGPGLSDFALWLRANGCRDRTIQERISHLGDFARHHPTFPLVNPMHVTAWLGRESLAPWSRATYYGHLRSYFTFAMENDLLAVDPMRRMRRPRVPKDKPRPLTPEQVNMVLTASAGSRNANLGAWLTLGLYAGLRAFEIAKLRGEDVTEDSIHVVGKGGTSAEIPTHPRIWALALNRPRQGYWFPTCSTAGHVTSLHVTTSTTSLFTACGIEGSIHRCRHTFGTQLLRGGANIRIVQTLMRHESLDSTMIYTDVSETEQLDAIRGLEARAVTYAVATFPKATHCGKGHAFSEANTYVTPAGRRQCRACSRDRYHAKRRALRSSPTAVYVASASR